MKTKIALYKTIISRNPIIIVQALFLITAVIHIKCNKNEIAEENSLQKELQNALDSSLISNNGIGASVAVIIPGKEIWLGVSGVSHQGTPISSDMIFNIASVTKTFVSALILQLCEEEKLSLDDSIYKWLPEFPNVDNTITVRQLLNHTSGIFDFWDHPFFMDSLFTDFTRRWTPEEMVKSFTLDPYFQPGTGYQYSNTNYILLGMIIVTVTGNDVSSEIRNQFLEPLDLNHTFFAVEEELTAEIAHGWFEMPPEDGILDDISTIPKTAFFSMEWTAGAMFSTANDIARWSQALFQGDVLSQSSLNQMLIFHPIYGYGLGISSFSPVLLNGVGSIGHGGENPGYRMMMLYLPDYSSHITVMMNEVNAECLFAIIRALSNIIVNR
jgi:D-alanyl-D-alanine carboxypeptidase